MILDSYQRPATAEIAIKEMADHHRIAGDFITQYPTVAALYTLVANDISSIGHPTTWRYPYSVERGTLKPSRRFSNAIMFAHHKLFTTHEKKPATDPRPGAIRLAYPNGLDGHKERAYILKLLTPLERYTALRHAITMKGYEEPRSWDLPLKRKKPK